MLGGLNRLLLGKIVDFSTEVRLLELEAESKRLHASNNSVLAHVHHHTNTQRKLEALARTATDPVQRNEYKQQAQIHAGRLAHHDLVYCSLKQAHQAVMREIRQVHARTKTLQSWKS